MKLREATPRSLLRAKFNTLVAVIYTAGTIAQVLRLVVRFEWQDRPYAPDWGLVLLGPPALAGLVLFAKEVRYRGAWERVVHWLIVIHLFLSVCLHVWILTAHTHEMLAVLPYEYSYFGVAYFAFFAWRSWTMELNPVERVGAAHSR